MNEDPRPRLRDLLLRRDLTPDEERRITDWLERHPESAYDWRAEAAVARGLRRLPPVPVPSNFTALVLAEVQRESNRQPTKAGPRWRWLNWRPLVPSLATVALLAVSLTGWNLVREKRQADYVRHVATLRALAGISPAVLQDFDAIQRFGDSSPPVDFELLAALQ